MIVIVDYGMGNVGSIANMLKKIGAQATLSADTYQIASADKLILPGVGAFDSCMQGLQARNLIPVLNECVLQRRIPILGICLGMQLFTRTSEEGKLPGLGWVNANTVRFRPQEQQLVRVPHMGWNSIQIQKSGALFPSFEEDSRFYFVHSYHVVCDSQEDVTALTRYGADFVSSFEHDNILGVQFHPEKSHRAGLQLLSNFVAWNGRV